MIAKMNDKGRSVVDAEWLRKMSDNELEEWATDLWDSMASRGILVNEIRNAVLGVLVKNEICPAHWLKDECPIEVYGRGVNIGGKYESDLIKLTKENIALRDKLKKRKE